MIFPVFLEDVDLDSCPGVALTLSSLNWIQPLKSPGGPAQEMKVELKLRPLQIREG